MDFQRYRQSSTLGSASRDERLQIQEVHLEAPASVLLMSLQDSFSQSHDDVNCLLL